MTEMAPEQPVPDETYVATSGVRFPGLDDVTVKVSGTFIESGSQLQQVFLGLEPVLLIQPEFDAEANEVDLVLTAVDLRPIGLVPVLEALLDTARLMAAEEQKQIDEYEAAQQKTD